MSKNSAAMLDLSPEQRMLLELRLKKRRPARQVIQAVSRQASNDPAPLSFAQQRLWFMHQLAGGSPIYNISARVHIRGPLNLSALEQALGEIIRRHEILRTRFPTVNGKPVQAVAPPQTLKLPVVDLSDIHEEYHQPVIQQLCSEQTWRRLDIEKVWPLSLRLLRLGQQSHALLITIHHIACDGWSQGIIIKEMMSLYDAFARGNASTIPELPIQHTDYAYWQREHLQEDSLQERLAYWKSTLKGATLLDLPTDMPRSIKGRSRGAVQTVTLPQEVSERLKALAHEQSVTLFMVLLAGFQSLLHRYSGQDDIIIGTPVANRRPVETEPLIGCFVNMLAIRANLSGNPTFSEVLSQAREVTLSAQANQDVPFEMITQHLRRNLKAGDSPLFRVLFVLHNAAKPQVFQSELRWRVVESKDGAIPYDLILSAVQSGGTITCTIRYNTDLFESCTIESMAEHFKTLIEECVACPHQGILDVPLAEQPRGVGGGPAPSPRIKKQPGGSFVFD